MKKQFRLERGRRLRSARIAVGLSQTQMAKKLGCSRQLVSALEAGGNLNADQLEAWCVACSCSSDVLLFEAPQAEAATGIERQLAGLEPGLRQRMLMLYQIFVRRGAPDRAAAPR